jgi:2'-hydroxyisoflavone reductase
MRILFIGGTRFVGLSMARAALLAGHEVDVFHRGTTSPKNLDGARHLIGDRTKDFTALQTGEWDVVVDVCGYRPHEIHAMADVVAGRHNKYVFVSTVSVYASDIPLMADESAALVDLSALEDLDPIVAPINAHTYGPLKVLCEQAVTEHYQNNLILRPSYVLGPEDYTKRFSQWVERISAGGEVLVPGPATAAMQYIDARDQANFLVTAIENDLRGTFTIANPQPPFSFGELIETVVETVGKPSTNLRWLDPQEAASVEIDFPLWAGGENAGMLALDTSKARNAGLVCRPLSQTVADIETALLAESARK